MLTAFTAQPILELKQRDKNKIESLLAYGDRLLVGLNSGTLRVYRVNELGERNEDEAQVQDGAGSKSTPRPVDLLREEEKFSKRPVHQLAIIKEANILVALSDGYVSIYDLQSYVLQERLERTKGATTFAVISSIVKDSISDIPSIASKLAVAVKRKIILWSWHDMELSSDVQELTLISTVKSLTWATGTSLVAGMDPGFVLLNTETEEVVDIVKPGGLGSDDGVQAGVRFGAVSSNGMGYMGMGSWVPKPMATKLADGEMLLVKDVNSLFVDSDGKALEKRQVPWAAAPESVGYSYPYMLALQPPARGILEVRNPGTLSLLQTVPLANAAILHVPQPNISLAHAGKGFFVASDRAIWRMGAIAYDAQIDDLITTSRFDEAISLVSLLEDTLLEDKVGKLRQIKILKAQELFEKRRYRDALYLFSEAEAPPASVISMYPTSIAAELSLAQQDSGDDETANKDAADEDNRSTKAPSLSSPHGTLTKTMLQHFRTGRHAPAAAPSVKRGRDGSDTASIRTKARETEGEVKTLEGKDFQIAVNELNAFLVQTRTQLQKYLNRDGTLKQAIPPVQERSKDYLPPFRNFIDLDLDSPEVDWEKKLLEVAGLVDTTLFRGYMLVRPALAGPLFRVDNFCDPEVVNEKLYESGRYIDLIDFLHGKKLHKEALDLLAKFGKQEESPDGNSNLQGPQRTVGYLQQLSADSTDLILEYAEWPLRSDPALGMQIFLADTENAESLPRQRVLEYLQRIDERLAAQYLEHIIHELNDVTQAFHQQLIDLYLDELKTDNPEKRDKSDISDKLEAHLRSSELYNRARVFGKLPNDNPVFFESRAIVLSKMGQHKQALQIYVFQIKDYNKAEDYCNHEYVASHSTTPSVPTPFLPPTDEAEDAAPSIYHTLLALYLTPPPPHQPNWPPALELLSKHGARLPASSTLSLIPGSLQVSELESYFQGRIRSAVSSMREEALVARLRAVARTDVDAKLLLKERNRRVTVSEDKVCGVCHKRFGGSAIRVYPDNTVVHYGCVRNISRTQNSSTARAWA